MELVLEYLMYLAIIWAVSIGGYTLYKYSTYISLLILDLEGLDSADSESKTEEYYRSEEDEFIPELSYEDKEFDSRIEKLKEELINANFPVEDTRDVRDSNIADILHPSVTNIPHDEVDASYGETGGEEASV